MRKLTMLTLGTLAAHATAVVLAPPALADDGQGGTLAQVGSPAAHTVRTFVTVLATLVGVVLLAKAVSRYRHSRWRRQWVMRRSTEALFVSSVRWPAGGISGRSIARPTAGITGMSGTSGPLAGHSAGSFGGSVARSSTRL